MLVLTDRPGRDGMCVTALEPKGHTSLQLYDYVLIRPPGESSRGWIGQIIKANLNIAKLTNDPFDPTLVQALILKQQIPDVEMAETMEAWEIRLLGEYDGQRLSTLRRRPDPASSVTRLGREDTIRILQLPKYEEQQGNVIGYLLNAEDVPLCVRRPVFRHHIMISGGTGSGKSNTGANLVYQAVRMGFTVFLYDAKPDYTKINQPNSDSTVQEIWEALKRYGLKPAGEQSLTRVAIYGIGRAHANKYQGYNVILGFRASDFEPEWLASLFFNPKSDLNQYEEFVNICRELRDTKQHYTLEDVLEVVEERSEEEETKKGEGKKGKSIHRLTARAIISKVNRRRKYMQWLDCVEKEVEEAEEESRQEGPRQAVLPFEEITQPVPTPKKPRTEPYKPKNFIGKSQVVYIDLADVDSQSYALFLGYFLRENQRYLANNSQARTSGVVEFVDEAHRIFTNDTRYSDLLEDAFNRTMMEGRSLNHGVIISLQNASQVPSSVLNNINTHIVMRQNNRDVARAATQTMGEGFADQSIGLAPGQALCQMFGSTATVLAQMAPSPYELERTDNV
jgi:DNA helicase HerA-like ATPase